MDINEALEAYKQAQKTISEFFDGQAVWEIRDCRDEIWGSDGQEICHMDKGECVYSFTPYNNRTEKDGLVLFTGRDNGETSCYIFKAENENNDENFWENHIWG